MITRTTKQLGLITSFLFVVVISAAAVLVYSIIHQGQTLLQKSQLVADQLVQEQTYASLDRLMRSSATERQELGRYVLTEPETIAFLSTVEGVATAQTATLKTDSLKVDKGKTFNTLVVSLTITGQQTSVEQVLRILETLPYDSYLNTLILQTSDIGDTTAQVQLVVTLMQHDQ